MSKARSSTPTEQPASYEEAMAELENLIAKMESGELPLEASINTYQRGAALVKYCQQILEKIDQQVQVLEADDQLKPFTPTQR